MGRGTCRRRLGRMRTCASCSAAPMAIAEPASRMTAFGVRLGLAIFGLILVEQLIRRAEPSARWALKPLCVGLAGIFAFDLYFFADALLFGRLDAEIWVARGAANALVIPFIAVATARNPMWTIEMHVSRAAVFHSTAVLVSGVFSAAGCRRRLHREVPGRRVGPGAADRIVLRRASRRHARGFVGKIPLAAAGIRQQALLLLPLRLPRGMVAVHADAVRRHARARCPGAVDSCARQPGRESRRRSLASAGRTGLPTRSALEHACHGCYGAGGRFAATFPGAHRLGDRPVRVRGGSRPLRRVGSSPMAPGNAVRLARRAAHVGRGYGRLRRACEVACDDRSELGGSRPAQSSEQAGRELSRPGPGYGSPGRGPEVRCVQSHVRLCSARSQRTWWHSYRLCSRMPSDIATTRNSSATC